MKYCVAWKTDPEICKTCYAEPQKYVCTKKDRRLNKENSCPTGKPEECQDPLDRYLNCKVCMSCPREDVQRIVELMDEWKRLHPFLQKASP